MKKILFKILFLSVLSSLVVSCNDFFNPETEDSMRDKDYIDSYTELYTGFSGVVRSVMEVAEKPGFWDGLRGLYLEPTYNTPQEMIDVYNYKEDLTGNEFASPVGLYNVVLQCNDFIAKAFEYLDENPSAVSDEVKVGIIGTALRYKAWAYLNLAKFFGEAIYTDDPFESFAEIEDKTTWNFDMLINKCIDLIENGVNGIDGKGEVAWSLELFPDATSTSVDQLVWDVICPRADMLLQELYLWKENFQRSIYHGVRLLQTDPTSEYFFASTMQNSGNKWVRAFSSYHRHTHESVLIYDYDADQHNNIQRYYSNYGENLYYFRPTGASIANHAVNAPSVRGDKDKTWTVNNGDTVSIKFFNNPSATGGDYYQQSDQWYRSWPVVLYRDADILLMLYEALVSLDRFDEALCMLHQRTNLYVDQATQTWVYPFTNEDYPIELGIGGSSSNANARMLGGIRGRVDIEDNLGVEVLDYPNPDPSIDRRYLDSIGIEEYFLEMEGEGKTTSAALRMIRRWNWDPEIVSIWAKKIGSKYPGGGVAVESKLASDPNAWFMKYNLFE